MYSYLCFEHPYKAETYKPVCSPPSTLTLTLHPSTSLPPFPLLGVREVDATEFFFSSPWKNRWILIRGEGCSKIHQSLVSGGQTSNGRCRCYFTLKLCHTILTEKPLSKWNYVLDTECWSAAWCPFSKIAKKCYITPPYCVVDIYVDLQF